MFSTPGVEAAVFIFIAFLIKSEAGGMTLNEEQNKKIAKLEQQKSDVVSEAQRLFPDYK